MSNETKWTKGPWRVQAMKNGIEHEILHGEYYVAVSFGGCPDEGRAGSNAHLIAAAPDGAALAELVMDFCGNPKGLSEAQQDELYETALQFMKKARGETS